MSFNLSECEDIRITRQKKHIKATYHIHGHDLSFVTLGNYLGDTLTSMFSWNAYVDGITKRTYNTLGFLRRNLARYPRDTQSFCYSSLVRPTTEYASAALDPHTSRNISQLEAVQHRAARFVMGDYKTTTIISQLIYHLGWDFLNQRRTNSRLVLMYRITDDLVDISQLKRPRHANPAHILQDRCVPGLPPLLLPSGNSRMDQLPEHIATAKTLDTFKARPERQIRCVK